VPTGGIGLSGTRATHGSRALLDRPSGTAGPTIDSQSGACRARCSGHHSQSHCDGRSEGDGPNQERRMTVAALSAHDEMLEWKEQQ
jgi:hypothetical protein